MDENDLTQRLHFLRLAERLKDTLRCAYTSQGRTESSAEHSWRLTLLVMTFSDQMKEVDLVRLLKMCILHDLGEAINGDIPAPLQGETKSDGERDDFLLLTASLPAHIRDEYLTLWEEYEAGSSPEARIAKAMDKLETIIQHNQGANPADFDYAFNLEYGRKQTENVPLARTIRAILDEETADRANGR